MIIGYKAAAAASLSVVGLVTIVSEIIIHYSSSSNDILHRMQEADAGGSLPGRVVAVPAGMYKETFKSSLSLGQCPSVKNQNGSIIKCSAEFEGKEVFLAKGFMTVDVSKVETSEDIMQHIMGGLGASVGVLGLVSVGVKYNVAVTTETSHKTLNLLSSYEMNKGILSLQSPSPKGTIPDSALYLSEIEYGGSELLLVTLDFQSKKQKIEVQVTITFKILFISISAKLKFVHNTFKSEAKVRIQFKSSWRSEIDESFDSLEKALPRVEAVEKMYLQGPKELRDMKNDDERSHNFYYFASWKQSPYGKNLNTALVYHDTDYLTEQYTEMMAVLERIKKLYEKDPNQPNEIKWLKETLTDKSQKLDKGLREYHTLSPAARQSLRDLYGQDKAPLYYTRELNYILE